MFTSTILRKTKMMKKYKIYQDYIGRGKDVTVMDIAKKHKVGRRQVHNAIDEVREGSTHQYNECMKGIRLMCLWESKYKIRFTVLDELPNSDELSNEYRLLFMQMQKNGFTPFRIAKFTGRDNSTIRYHLKRGKQRAVGTVDNSSDK